MKKLSLFILGFILGCLISSAPVSATLWNYYQEQSQNLPSFEDRIPLATQCGIDNYKGLESQNMALEECLRKGTSQSYMIDVYGTLSIDNNGLLGADVPKRPTEFKTNLAEQKTEGHSDTTLVVTSITTKDGNTLDASVLGDKIVLSINSGASNSETVVCTGLTTATKTFTGCTFGYRFDDPTETASANIEAHSPGEPVIISNTDTYLAQAVVYINGDQLIQGSKSIASSTENISKLYFGDNYGAYFWYNSTTDQFGWASSTDEYQFGTGGTQFTVQNPLNLLSGQLRNATSSYWFRLEDSSKLAVATSTIFNADTAIIKFLNFSVEPTSSSTGDRYISNATSTGDVSGHYFFNNYIYTRATSDWTTTTPTNVMSVYNKTSSTFELFSTVGTSAWTADNSFPDTTGSAGGFALDDYWNDRYNATSTKGNLLTLYGGYMSYASSTQIGNWRVDGNTTSTGALYIMGDLTVDGLITSETTNYKTWVAEASTTDLRVSALKESGSNATTWTTAKQVVLYYPGYYHFKWKTRPGTNVYFAYARISLAGGIGSAEQGHQATTTPGQYVSYDTSLNWYTVTSTPVVASLQYRSSSGDSIAYVRDFEVYYTLTSTSTDYLRIDL